MSRLARVALGLAAALLVLVTASLLRSRLDPRESTATDTPIVPMASLDEAESRLRLEASGSVWTPAPGDGAIFGSDRLVIDGAIEPRPSHGFGIGVSVDGEASIALAAAPGAIEVDVEIESGDFDGSVSVFAAAGTATEARWTLRREGSMVLAAGHGLDARSDEATIDRIDGPFVLGLALRTRSVEGSVDGQRFAEVGRPGVVVDSARDERLVGLRLDGRGTLRIRRLQWTRLAE